MVDEKSLREALLTGAREGHLLQTVYANLSAGREERGDLANELAALHNEGLVDVVATFEGLKNSVPGGPDFFLTRHVFEEVLPHLAAPVALVMRCVLGLCREAGQDMAAGTIFSAYIEFCTRDAVRPREALKLIEADPNALADMLVATVAAGSQLDNPYYLAETLRLIRHPDIEVRRRAVFAIARIHWPEGSHVPDTTITALQQAVASGTDGRILGGAIKSAFALFEQNKTREGEVITLIGAALAKGDEHVTHAASELLWLNFNELPPTLLTLLLIHLKQVKPENIGTLNNIDYGIANLLRRDDPEQGVGFLEDLLITHNGRVNIGILDSAVGVIRENTKLLSKVLTRWFLRGDQVLCEAVHEIVSAHHNGDLHIEIDGAELEPADYVHILFMAHKAIGYFFMKPITAASVVMSLMRCAPDAETLDALGDLLLDPLLLNYTGGMRDYVAEQAGRESGKVRETIENALASIEQYLEVLRATPELPALYAGQSQRESYRRHMSGSMAASMKAAEKKSIFLSMVSRSTLLYGSKSINYIYVGDGEPHRMEIPLTRHGVSMEYPRMDYIDPYGLNYMLRVFRVERFRT